MSWVPHLTRVTPRRTTTAPCPTWHGSCCGRCAGTTRSRRAWSSSPPRSGSASIPWAACCPSERELAERMHVSRATLREAIVALRAAGPGRDPPGTWRRHGGHHEAADAVGPQGGANARPRNGRTGSTPGRSGGSSSRAPPASCRARPRWTTRPGRGWRRPTWPWHGRPAGPPRTGRPTAASTSTFASLTGSPRTIESVTSVQASLHEMLSADPGAGRQHRALGRPARPRSCAPCWPAGRTAPARPWKNTATTRPRCCAACSAEERPRWHHPTTAS